MGNFVAVVLITLCAFGLFQWFYSEDLKDCRHFAPVIDFPAFTN